MNREIGPVMLNGFSLMPRGTSQVTGDLQKAHQICELWAQTYPRDANSHAMLSAFVYQPFGTFEASVREAAAAVAIDPDFFAGYFNLVGECMFS